MYTINLEQLENDLRSIDDDIADIFDWVVGEFNSTQAWIELTEMEFKMQTGDAVLWCKIGDKIINEQRYKWDLTGSINRYFVQSYRNDNAPIKGWLRRAMQYVHGKRRYSQKDIGRIARAIRESVSKI